MQKRKKSFKSYLMPVIFYCIVFKTTIILRDKINELIWYDYKVKLSFMILQPGASKGICQKSIAYVALLTT